ncbi:MAG TPA: hypothetical protein VN112_12995 [Ensifer sp.]|nr:hypothetical protein [Ensifer sp.]
MKNFAIAILIAAAAATSVATVAEAKMIQVPPGGTIKLPPNVKIKTPGPIKIMPIDPITPAKPPVSKGYDDGALAFGLGLATVGVIAAAAASHSGDYGDCWYEKRVRYDAYGYKHVKKIRVCE